MEIQSVFNQLKHPNPNLRQRAIWQLAEAHTEDETIIPRLMDLLGEEDVVYRRASVKALGAIGADAVPFLVETLRNSEDPTVRASCTKALAQLAVNYRDRPFPPEGIEGLKLAVNDANPVVHIAGVMALGAIGPAVLELLIEILQTTDNPAIAVATVNALGSMGDIRAAEVLNAFADDESADSYVRESATSALSRMDQVIGFRKGKG